jgi:hypothetical protein
MGLSLLIGSVASADMWAVIVVLPAVQHEFGAERAGASTPHRLTMLGFYFGAVALCLSRLEDPHDHLHPIQAASRNRKTDLGLMTPRRSI